LQPELAIDGTTGVGHADLRLFFIDTTNVRDTGTGRDGDVQFGHGFFPHAFQSPTKRHPNAALRAGHEGKLLRRGRSSSQGRRDGECAKTEFSDLFHDVSVSMIQHRRLLLCRAI
jgi:hypothetical protein